MTAASVAVDDLAAVAGIVDVLGKMLAEKNASRADLAERNKQLSGRVTDLSGQVEALLERVAKLEWANSRNSGNSGMPPSADDLPGKTAPAPKPKRGGKRRQGKQPGAPVHHVPVERCAGIVEALTGTRPSDGFVLCMIARAAKAVREVNMLIRALVITASVVRG